MFLLPEVLDITSPTVVVTDNLADTANRNTAGVEYTLAFSENVSGLSADDFTISNGTIDTIVGSGNTWKVNVIPALGVASGTIDLTLKAGAVSDLAGNTNVVVVDNSQAIDTVIPPAPKLVPGSAFNFLVDPQVTLQTNYGAVVIELYAEQAPVTVANLLAYVDAGFYDNTLIHRVIPNFVVQGGGFGSDGYFRFPLYDAIPLESNNGISNVRGTVAMARTSAPDSATTQFFVNLTDNSSLDYTTAAAPGYAVFGEVTSGIEVIDAIAQVPTTTSGSYENVPVSPVVIASIDQTAAGSSITNNATLQVSGLENGGTWAYSLNGGVSWVLGSGSSLVVPVGSYDSGDIQVRQADAAGNISWDGKLPIDLDVDTTPPVVSDLSPADAATDVAINSDIVITFSEEVQRWAGNISIKTGEGTVVATYDAATSANLSISGDTLTINPSADLMHSTQYKVEFTAGTIRDLAGNSYTGTTSYDFITVNETINPVHLTGTTGNDTFNGTTGDDTFTGLAGDDNINGGAGNDTAIYSGVVQDYLILENGTGDYIVIDLNADDTDEGRDILSEIEFLQFTAGSSQSLANSLTDLTLIDDDSNHWNAGIGLPNGDQIEPVNAQLYRLYSGAMGRTPDNSGYSWWLGALAGEYTDDQGNPYTFTSASEGFMWSPEFRSYFGVERGDDISNDVFLNHMYQGVFGREPDQGGFNWWMDNLENGYKSSEPGYESQVQALADMTQSNEYVELTMTGVVDYLYGVAEFA